MNSKPLPPGRPGRAAARSLSQTLFAAGPGRQSMGPLCLAGARPLSPYPLPDLLHKSPEANILPRQAGLDLPVPDFEGGEV